MRKFCCQQKPLLAKRNRQTKKLSNVNRGLKTVTAVFESLAAVWLIFGLGKHFAFSFFVFLEILSIKVQQR